MSPLIFSCEHATCAIPEANKEAVQAAMDRITSAEGWDLGSLNLAQGFSMKFRTPLVHCEYSRLLIDCYCQESDPARWSDLSEKMTDNQRERFQEKHLKLHAQTLAQRVANELERHPSVVHISVHTFDPATHPDLHVSLLYSEGKVGESTLGLGWMKAISDAMPHLRVRPNETFYPAQSKTLLDTLRSNFGSEKYIGLELQVSNDIFLSGNPVKWDKCKLMLQDTLRTSLE